MCRPSRSRTCAARRAPLSATRARPPSVACPRQSCPARVDRATRPHHGSPRGCRPSRARSTPACRHGRRAHRSRRVRRPSEGVRYRSSAAPGACARDRCRWTPNAEAAASLVKPDEANRRFRSIEPGCCAKRNKLTCLSRIRAPRAYPPFRGGAPPIGYFYALSRASVREPNAATPADTGASHPLRAFRRLEHRR